MAYAPASFVLDAEKTTTTATVRKWKGKDPEQYPGLNILFKQLVLVKGLFYPVRAFLFCKQEHHIINLEIKIFSVRISYNFQVLS